MQLLKSHREALLTELDKAQHDKSIQDCCFVKEQEKQSDLVEWFEISVFLAQQRINLIKQALTDNEIDY